MKISTAAPVIKEIKDLNFLKKPKYPELLECADWLEEKSYGMYYTDAIKAKRWAAVLREMNRKK